MAIYDFGLDGRGSKVDRKKISSEVWPFSNSEKRRMVKILTVMITKTKTECLNYFAQFVDLTTC